MLLFLVSYIESTSIVGVIDPPNIAGHQNISDIPINPLNAELNLICHLLALLAHPILHVSRIRVKSHILS